MASWAAWFEFYSGPPILKRSAGDPDHFDAVPDPTGTFQSDAGPDPDPTFPFDPDPILPLTFLLIRTLASDVPN